MNEAQARAIFLLAGIEVLAVYATENGYGGKQRDDSWWLIKTKRGLIHIGWRSHVISIDWSDTDVRCPITRENITHGLDHVHAYGYAKAVEHMGNFKLAMSRKEKGICPACVDRGVYIFNQFGVDKRVENCDICLRKWEGEEPVS